MTQRQSQVKVLTIHEFAQICRTTIRTIRFYTKLGLLQPVRVDPYTKYRYYQPWQAREFFKIRLLQNFRVPLKEIKKAAKKYSEEDFLDHQLGLVKGEITEKEKEYTFLDRIKKFLFGEKPTQFLRLEWIGPYNLFCMYVPAGRFDQINSHIYQLFDLAKKYKISHNRRPMTIYWDPPDIYKPKDAKFEVGLICKSKKRNSPHFPKNVYFKTYPRQKALTYTYKGPFGYLTFIHKKVYELVGAKRLGGNPFDIHFAGPWNKQLEYDHLTKVGYPVRG